MIDSRVNALIEQIHLTMGDMLRTQEFVQDPRNQWIDDLQNMLKAIAWAYRKLQLARQVVMHWENLHSEEIRQLSAKTIS